VIFWISEGYLSVSFRNSGWHLWKYFRRLCAGFPADFPEPTAGINRISSMAGVALPPPNQKGKSPAQTLAKINSALLQGRDRISERPLVRRAIPYNLQ
jgi:hypothetical protein